MQKSKILELESSLTLDNVQPTSNDDVPPLGNNNVDTDLEW